MRPLFSSGRVREMTASVGVTICSVLEVDSSAVASSINQLPAASTRGAAVPQINVQIRSSDKQLRKTTHLLSRRAGILASHLLTCAVGHRKQA